MTKLDELVLQSEDDIGFYLSEVTQEDFISDVKNMAADYSDGRAIDRAIKLLISCRTVRGDG